MKLYKTTIVVLSDYDPTNLLEVEDLISEAVNGDNYLYSRMAEEIDSDNLAGEGVKEFFGCLPDEEIEIPNEL